MTGVVLRQKVAVAADQVSKLQDHEEERIGKTWGCYIRAISIKSGGPVFTYTYKVCLDLKKELAAANKFLIKYCFKFHDAG